MNDQPNNKKSPLIPLGELLEKQFNEALDRLEIVARVSRRVHELLRGETTGHDWWHIVRVRRIAEHIAQWEDVDSFTVSLAALLHDIGDWKFTGGDETVGPARAREYLFEAGAPKSVINHVCEIVKTISFKGAGVKSEMKTLEGKIVQDADRLDAIGAIGIARAFAYGGSKGRELYDPEVKPELHKIFDDYKAARGSTINHFHEKLLLLKDLLNTETAREIATSRHAFMQAYLDQFHLEWEGGDYREEDPDE